jgi:alginate O-acetyltransferase complex protein AlgI
MSPIAVLILLSFLCLGLRQAWRKGARHDLAFLAFSIVFLVLILSPAALAWLSAFMAAGYLVVRVAGRFKALHPLLFIGPLALLFAVFKRYDILPLHRLYTHIPEVAGLSFIIFRVIMVLFDAREEKAPTDIATYLSFCLSPLTFISGPVQRLRDFREDMTRSRDFRLAADEGAAALTRMMNGLIQVLLLAPLAQSIQTTFVVAAAESTLVARLPGLFAPVGYGLAALSYLLFLYFNFSGYTDIVIALGRLFGFRLPENFDMPVAATSFLDFWSRWHISLSLWFRDYCFTPILKEMVKAGITNRVVATLPAYFISFGLLGLWHGRTWPFFLCGFLFALGSVANQLVRTAGSRMLGKKRMARLGGNPAWQAVASASTFLYIAIAVLGLWRTGPEVSAILRSFAQPRAFLAVFLLIFALAAGLLLFRILSGTPVIRKTFGPFRMLFDGQSAFLIALKAFVVIVWYFTLSTHLPDFVYRGF